MEHAIRRQKILDQMPAGSAFIVSASHAQNRNNDVNYRFRQRSNFFYLTEIKEENAIILLIKFLDGKEKQVVFVEPHDEFKALWQGPQLGPDGAKKILNVDEGLSLLELDESILEMLHGIKRIYYPFAEDKKLESKLREWSGKLSKGKRTESGPTEFFDANIILGEMRLFKSDYELKQMRRAAKASVDAHARAMAMSYPGINEYEIEAELLYEFTRQGCIFSGYNSIVGGGINSCVLHYEANNQLCNDGDVVLIDAGAEYNCYAADITRTFPVNGKFTNKQKSIYELVLDAQLAVIDLVKPGTEWIKLQEAAVKFLTKGLVRLNILEGQTDKLIADKSYAAFYPHLIGHWLGLDVHDAGSYKVNGQWRILEPGMVLTIEPGLYFGSTYTGDYQGIGVRIEDDILVTDKGCDILTAQLPKKVDEIESLVGSGR